MKREPEPIESWGVPVMVYSVPPPMELSRSTASCLEPVGELNLKQRRLHQPPVSELKSMYSQIFKESMFSQMVL